MPVKFKSDDKRLVRGTKKVITTKHFIKNTPKQELIDYINSSNAKPKIVQKCRNECLFLKFSFKLFDYSGALRYAITLSGTMTVTRYRRWPQ